jgi:hypothetical protein
MAKRTFYNRVKGGIGVRNKGFLYARRNAKGQFSNMVEDDPVNVAAYNWPSLERYGDLIKGEQITKLISSISGWVKHMEYEGTHIVYNALLPAFNTSKIYCPKSPNGSRGTPIRLVESARLKVELQKGSETKMTATISYGHSGNPFYAVYVHELLRNKHEPPTRSKFLEMALIEHRTQIQRDLAAGAKQATTGAK